MTRGLLPCVATRCNDSIVVAADDCHRRGQTTSATTRQLQHERYMGKITIMPLSFVYSCLSVRIMILPLQLISNYF